MKKMTGTKMLFAVFVLLAAAGGLAAFALLQRANEPFKRYTDPDRLVEIPSGLGTGAIGQRLVDAGIVRDRIAYRVALWLNGKATRLQAGEYRFDRPMTAREVIEKIVRGEVDQAAITFREGLTIAEMAAVFEGDGFGPAATFVAAGRDASLIADLDPAAKDLEGYLFPDTYKVSRRIDAARLVRAMVNRTADALTPELRRAAANRGLSVRQLVTLASLVEKETGQQDERRLVAGVYANRLRIGMALQCDPTVIYALQRLGRYNGNLRRDDLALDSPYNTYRYPGLPPGPIAAPGQASLEAAASPADVDFLYFVSRNDGSHVFSRSLEEHNRNVRRFQVQFFREGRRGGRGL
jgi:UPF0755 protein